MDFGLGLPQGAQNNLQRDVIMVAKGAEEAGFDSLWAYERVLFPLTPSDGLYGIDGLPWLPYYRYCADPLTLLTLAGAVTQTIRLGTSVLVAPLHSKLHLARTLATLDQATGGRVTVGLGGGWSTDEYAAAGADFAGRGQAFDEVIDALRAMHGPDPVTYRDSRIVVDNALVSPKPVTELPILIGGGQSKRALRRIAEKGDGWMPVNMSGRAIASTWKQLLDHAESAGRDPGAMRLVPVAPYTVVTRKPAGPDRELFQGTPEQLVEDFAAIAEAGAHELIIGLDSDAASAGELLDKATSLLYAAAAAGLRRRLPAPVSRLSGTTEGKSMNAYDYIVIGGGTAGCVLAARLSEDPSVTVLLIEAGSATAPAQAAQPPAWMALLGGECDWRYTTTPQADAGVLAYPRGRLLGGSSGINAMIHLRGHRAGYDQWIKAGAPGWGYEDLLPYFQRSERTEGRNPWLRGTGGPLRVAPASPGHPIAQAFIDAAEQAGYQTSKDLNGTDQSGAGWVDLNVVDGTRQSASDGYLHPVLDRPNLTVAAGSQALRLLFEYDRCTGVRYPHDGRLTEARALREVVLSAGAIGSPQLLMLSGIGPAGHLRELGIEVYADLPEVGANLQDHPHTVLIHQVSRPVPAGSNNNVEAIAALSSGLSGELTDVQLFAATLPVNPPPLPTPDNGFVIGVVVTAPRSRGTVRLKSPAPEVAPLIDPRLLDDPHDLDVLDFGIQTARTIAAAPALADWGATEIFPAGLAPGGAERRAFLRQAVTHYCHPVGTCRLGSDRGSVVDLELRVRGIDGLRVADASVMPAIPTANTNATVLAIAERAADLITGR